jgi:hypothetical protein
MSYDVGKLAKSGSGGQGNAQAATALDKALNRALIADPKAPPRPLGPATLPKLYGPTICSLPGDPPIQVHVEKDGGIVATTGRDLPQSLTPAQLKGLLAKVKELETQKDQPLWPAEKEVVRKLERSIEHQLKNPSPPGYLVPLGLPPTATQADAQRAIDQRGKELLTQRARVVGLPLSADWKQVWAAEDHAAIPTAR